jgi:hypothetical protein
LDKHGADIGDGADLHTVPNLIAHTKSHFAACSTFDRVDIMRRRRCGVTHGHRRP